MTSGKSSKAVAVDREGGVLPQLTRAVWAGLLLTVGMRSPCSCTHEFGSKVVGVTHGDTSTVLRDPIEMRVRLDGIGCPESSQAFSPGEGVDLRTLLRQGGHGSAEATQAAGYRAGRDCHR